MILQVLVVILTTTVRDISGRTIYFELNHQEHYTVDHYEEQKYIKLGPDSRLEKQLSEYFESEKSSSITTPPPENDYGLVEELGESLGPTENISSIEESLGPTENISSIEEMDYSNMTDDEFFRIRYDLDSLESDDFSTNEKHWYSPITDRVKRLSDYVSGKFKQVSKIFPSVKHSENKTLGADDASLVTLPEDTPDEVLALHILATSNYSNNVTDLNNGLQINNINNATDTKAISNVTKKQWHKPISGPIQRLKNFLMERFTGNSRIQEKTTNKTEQNVNSNDSQRTKSASFDHADLHLRMNETDRKPNRTQVKPMSAPFTDKEIEDSGNGLFPHVSTTLSPTNNHRSPAEIILKHLRNTNEQNKTILTERSENELRSLLTSTRGPVSRVKRSKEYVNANKGWKVNYSTAKPLKRVVEPKVTEQDFREAEKAKIRFVLTMVFVTLGTVAVITLIAFCFVKDPKLFCIAFASGCPCICYACPCLAKWVEKWLDPSKVLQEKMNTYMPGVIVHEDGKLEHYKPTPEEMECVLDIIEEIVG